MIGSFFVFIAVVSMLVGLLSTMGWIHWRKPWMADLGWIAVCVMVAASFIAAAAYIAF